MSEDIATPVGGQSAAERRGERRRALQAERDRQAQRGRRGDVLPVPGALPVPDAPDPRPVPVAAEPAPVPAPEPAVDPAPEAAVDPAPEAAVEPSPEAAVEPSPEAAVEPPAEPAAEPAPEAAVESAPKPSPEPTAEPSPDVDSAGSEPVLYVDVAGPEPMQEAPEADSVLVEPVAGESSASGSLPHDATLPVRPVETAPSMQPFGPAVDDSGWSAFTPVIPPEPLRFDDEPAPWERPQPWTLTSGAPGSWMDERRPAVELFEDSAPPVEPLEDSAPPVEPLEDSAPSVEPAADPARLQHLGDDEWLSHLRGDEATLAAPEAPAADVSRTAAEESQEVRPLTPPDGWTPEGWTGDVPAEAIGEPLVDEPASAEPVVDEPVVDEPVVDESVVEEPVVDEPVLDEGLPDELHDAEPLVEEPLAERPPAAWAFSDVPTLQPTDDGALPGEESPTRPDDAEPDADADVSPAHRPVGTPSAGLWLAEHPDPELSASETPVPSAQDPSDEDDEMSASEGSASRLAFGRPSAQRLSEMPAKLPEAEPDDEEPVRGTLEPVLRRSTERARYPTSTTPVIRPPVLPPLPGEPGEPAAAAPPPRLVSWEQALAQDVLPSGGRRGGKGRSSKPRHESGGAGEEYRPKAAPDRTLTLLVVAMLLLLAGLVAAAAWTFWPREVAVGRTGPTGVVLAAQRAVSGP